MWNDVKNEVNVRPKPCAVPGLTAVSTGRPSSWGEVLILAYISERLWLMIRVLCYDDSGLSSMDVIKSCGTRVQPLQSVKPIRIAVSTVTDDWKGHTISVIITMF